MGDREGKRRGLPDLRTPGEPLPPAREQLPLPRREQQSHLEPQLREPLSPGHGTPFVAFAESATTPMPRQRPARGDASAEATAELPARSGSAADRAAEFRTAAQRGRADQSERPPERT